MPEIYMLNDEKIKKDLLFTVTFSVEEASKILGVSPTTIKNRCRGNLGKHKDLKTIDFRDFDINTMAEGTYKDRDIDVIVLSGGKRPVYRLLIHAIDTLIKSLKTSFYSDRDREDFLKLEEQKLEFRKKIIKEIREKYLRNF
jgi:hypothetical protein